jgi:hypothetical protein
VPWWEYARLGVLQFMLQFWKSGLSLLPSTIITKRGCGITWISARTFVFSRKPEQERDQKLIGFKAGSMYPE